MRKETEAAINRFGQQLYEIKLSSQETKILPDDLMYNQGLFSVNLFDIMNSISFFSSYINHKTLRRIIEALEKKREYIEVRVAYIGSRGLY